MPASFSPGACWQRVPCEKAFVEMGASVHAVLLRARHWESPSLDSVHQLVGTCLFSELSTCVIGMEFGFGVGMVSPCAEH